MLKGASVETEDEQEEAIMDLEGWSDKQHLL
jgi:hypothetical protein